MRSSFLQVGTCGCGAWAIAVAGVSTGCGCAAASGGLTPPASTGALCSLHAVRLQGMRLQNVDLRGLQRRRSGKGRSRRLLLLNAFTETCESTITSISEDEEEKTRSLVLDGLGALSGLFSVAVAIVTVVSPFLV